MRSASRDSAQPLRAAFLACALGFAVSSCTTGDPNMQLALSGNATPAAQTVTVPGMMAEAAAEHASANAGPAGSAAAEAETSTTNASATAPAQAVPPSDAAAQTAAIAELQDVDGVLLPDEVAYVPTTNPEARFEAVMPALDADAGTLPASGEAPRTAMQPVPDPATGSQVPVPSDAPAAPGAIAVKTAYADAAPSQAPAKPRGFFASLFAASATQNVDAGTSAHQQPRVVVASLDNGGARPLIAEDTQPKPLVDTVSQSSSPPPSRHAASGDALPGVRRGESLFEITRKSGVGDNSDVDINEEDAGSVEVASAAGLARLDPHGLLLQRETVETACLRPALLTVLKKIEQHYGRKLIVTSGYRSPVHNAAARGARNSLHMFCAAADVQMPGVSKWELASYARSMPGRGGVGTYCYTKSVHIDIGPERDWNWRCRRGRHRRR